MNKITGPVLKQTFRIQKYKIDLNLVTTLPQTHKYIVNILKYIDIVCGNYVVVKIQLW